MITIVSGKGAPGATTTLAAMVATWPAPVLLADCDHAGGDLATGWLGQWIPGGKVRTDRGVLSHATATRHASAGDPATLLDHVQQIPPAPRAALLSGFAAPGQHAAVDAASWARLTVALASFRTSAGQPADALVDVGRFGADTPWPLLLAADVVLVAVRPTQRHVLAARPVLAELADRIASPRLGLAVCATTPSGTRDVRAALGLDATVEIPADARSAAVFSDGVDGGVPARRSPVLRAAARAACHLHTTHHHYTLTELRAPLRPNLAIGGARLRGCTTDTASPPARPTTYFHPAHRPRAVR